MTSLLSRQGKTGGSVVEAAPLTRVGQVFLDVQRRNVACLDPVARQLHHEGVPFTPADLEKRKLLHSSGEPVAGAELPLIVAWRELRPVEATFLLPVEKGPELCVTWHVAPVRNGRGELIGLAGTVRCAPPDPDWRAMAGLAHDLGTPLQGIRLQLAALEALTAGHPQMATVIRGLQGSTERALRVGLELLKWFREPGHKLRGVELAWFPLEPVLSDLAREQSLLATNKGLILTTDFSTSQGWEVRTDRHRLTRILSNLLVNAIRYTPLGRVEFTTSWRDEAKGRQLAIGVVDTGVGISAEEQESIFNPFERGKAGLDSDSGGSGLGLAVVDRLVEELEVELEVYSEHGRGSAFHLLLPAEILRPVKPQPAG
jgi:anti-sigma regulatory factor (Ser/Thr protein kinase)